MILIYSHISTTRLQYICRFIFAENLGVAYSITNDPNGFEDYEGPKLNYSHQDFSTQVFTIRPVSLLFEKGIQAQLVTCFEWQSYKAFYKTENSDFDFDVFAASFYLISRYEEWLPHSSDIYGRYAHENSLAFKEGFLKIPLVNIWMTELGKTLQKQFNVLQFKPTAFKFLPTYDIDIAWSYKNKGLLRSIGGIIQTKSLARLPVLMRLQKDPFDSYDFLEQLHSKFKLKPVYFFLLAQRGSEYDKNINPYDYSMWQLIKRLAKNGMIGLHPSWRSFSNPQLVKKEQQILHTASKLTIEKSRQHYIKFEFPKTFETLIEQGITDDFSMGYGSINGFRASVASSFLWYNFRTESIANLRMHPFCFMDANSYYEQKQSSQETKKELLHYLQICKQVNGQLITIFHNNFLGTDRAFKGWSEAYTEFIAQVQQ